MLPQGVRIKHAANLGKIGRKVKFDGEIAQAKSSSLPNLSLTICLFVQPDNFQVTLRGWGFFFSSRIGRDFGNKESNV